MTEERRDAWKVAGVLRAGEGPLTPAVDICGVYKITAREAAECYIDERLDDDLQDGDLHHAAVNVSGDKWLYFQFRSRIQHRLEIFSAKERAAAEFG